MPLDGTGLSGVASGPNYCGSRFHVPGSRFVFSVPVRSSAFFVPCSVFREPGTTNHEPERRTRTRNLEPGTRNRLVRKFLAGFDVRAEELDAGGVVHRPLADDLGEQKVGNLFDFPWLQRGG